MAFKRVLRAKTAFKKYSAKLSPEVQKEWENKFTEKGLFQLKEQTAQVRRPRPHFFLTLSDLFIFTSAQIGSLHRLVSFFLWIYVVLVADLVVPTASG
jgi:hypothetical protein